MTVERISTEPMLEKMKKETEHKPISITTKNTILNEYFNNFKEGEITVLGGIFRDTLDDFQCNLLNYLTCKGLVETLYYPMHNDLVQTFKRLVSIKSKRPTSQVIPSNIESTYYGTAIHDDAYTWGVAPLYISDKETPSSL